MKDIIFEEIRYLRIEFSFFDFSSSSFWIYLNGFLCFIVSIREFIVMLCRISGSGFNQKEIPLHSFFLLKIIYIPFLCKIHKHRIASTMRKDTQTQFYDFWMIYWKLNDMQEKPDFLCKTCVLFGIRNCLSAM